MIAPSLQQRLIRASGRLSFGNAGLVAVTGAVFLFLYLPIAVIVLFAFDNKPVAGLPIEGLTLDWFRAALHDDVLLQALGTSTVLALAAASLACALAMPAAMTLAWVPLRFKSLVVGLVIGPIVIPQMVIGIALALLLRNVPQFVGGIGIIIGHTTLTACYATMILQARLLGFRKSLIEAAWNLGANDLRVFWEVILPIARPALVAVFLLAFTDAFGEFIVAWFVAGFTKTLPITIWTSLRQVISPELNAICTVIIAASLGISIVAQLWMVRRARRDGMAVGS